MAKKRGLKKSDQISLNFPKPISPVNQKPEKAPTIEKKLSEREVISLFLEVFPGSNVIKEATIDNDPKYNKYSKPGDY